MAVAIETQGWANDGGAGNTSNIDVASSGSDRKAIIFVWGDFDAEPTTTVGGSSTGVNEISRITLTGNQKIIAYYYDSPPTASTTYEVTETASFPEIHVITYSGCATGAVDSFASKTGDTSPLDLTTTVVGSNAWLVSAGRNYTTGVINASTGTTQRNSGAGIKSGDSNGTVGTGPQTMEWTNGGSGNTGGIIVSILPKGATASNTSHRLGRLTLMGVG